MNESDRRNPRRLIRAIEVALQVKSPKSRQEGGQAKVQSRSLKLKVGDLLMVGLTAANRVLYERIDKRVEVRVGQGMKDEIEGLLKRGYDWENAALGTTLGYREWQSYFEKEAVREEVIQKWKFAEHAYARRQKTWFRKDKRIRWFDIASLGWEERVEKLVKRWYTGGDYAEKD